MLFKDILAILLGLMGIGFTLLMFMSRNTVKTAYYLVVVFLSFAGFYFLLEAYFIGFVQLIVYAGAIMVMVLFTLNYFSAEQEIQRGETDWAKRWFVYLVSALCVVMLIFVFATFQYQNALTESAPNSMILADSGAAAQIDKALAQNEPVELNRLSKTLFSKFLLPFELTSVVILLAMVGAIYLTWNRRAQVADADKGGS